MTQYARPNSDGLFQYWSGSYTDIDEVTYSDADYITGDEDENGTSQVGLSNVTDPNSSVGHTVKFRAWQEDQADQRTLKVELLQGSTVISTYTAFNLVKGTPTAYSWTLSSGEADNITDYTDLVLRFTSAGDVTPPPATRAFVYVSWAVLEVPDAGTTYYETPLGVLTPANALIKKPHKLESGSSTPAGALSKKTAFR